MNANELADKLEQGHWEGGTREQAATMLRQQQATIEEMLEALIAVEVWLSSGCATGFESKVSYAILKAQEK